MPIWMAIWTCSQNLTFVTLQGGSRIWFCFVCRSASGYVWIIEFIQMYRRCMIKCFIRNIVAIRQCSQQRLTRLTFMAFQVKCCALLFVLFYSWAFWLLYKDNFICDIICNKCTAACIVYNHEKSLCFAEIPYIFFGGLIHSSVSSAHNALKSTLASV